VTIPDHYRFRYRIFASADIIGSTAFKSGQAKQGEPWAHVFRGFFDEFPKVLAAEFDRLDELLIPGAKPSACMEVWKFAGDEILFVAELVRHEEAVYHVLALKSALNAYSDKLAHKGLGLKGTVWGAGFPVMNVQVTTSSAPDGMSARDFLGPSIDLGFRLATLADRRRIPISADIAAFLLAARRGPVVKALHILVDPPQALKGIDAAGGYPILWVDRRDGRETPEDRLLHRPRRCDPDALAEYLDEQFRAGTAGLMRPFIERDKTGQFADIPAEFVARRDALVSNDLDLRYDTDSQESDPSTVGTVPPLPAQASPTTLSGPGVLKFGRRKKVRKKPRRRG
jgi:hypothetical protein